MAKGHVHSVSLRSGGYHHLYNLMFMTDNEIEVLRLMLENKPIPRDRVDVVDSLRNTVGNIHDIAIRKNRDKDDTDKETEEVKDDEAEFEIVNDEDND